MPPLPATEATVESMERGGSSVVVVVRVVSETDEVQLQTRWKDRDGEPKIVEVSHLSRKELAVEAAPEDGEAAEGAGEGRSQPERLGRRLARARDFARARGLARACGLT